MELVKKGCATGHWHEVAGAVRLRLTGFMASNDEVKVGAASNLDRRVKAHSADGWRKMVLVYSTSSKAIAQRAERELIAFGKGNRLRVSPVNVLPGGESLADGRARYWIYFLVG